MNVIEQLAMVETKEGAAAAAAGVILAIAEVTPNPNAKRAAVAVVDMIERVWGMELAGPAAETREQMREV